MGKYERCVAEIKKLILEYADNKFYSEDDKLEAILTYIDSVYKPKRLYKPRRVGELKGDNSHRLKGTGFHRELKELKKNKGKVIDLAKKYSVTTQAVHYHLRKLKEPTSLIESSHR